MSCSLRGGASTDPLRTLVCPTTSKSPSASPGGRSSCWAVGEWGEGAESGWSLVQDGRETVGDRTTGEAMFSDPHVFSIIPIDYTYKTQKTKLIRISKWFPQSIKPQVKSPFWEWGLVWEHQEHTQEAGPAVPRETAFPAFSTFPRQSLVASWNLVLLQWTWLSLKLPENALLFSHVHGNWARGGRPNSSSTVLPTYTQFFQPNVNAVHIMTMTVAPLYFSFSSASFLYTIHLPLIILLPAEHNLPLHPQTFPRPGYVGNPSDKLLFHGSLTSTTLAFNPPYSLYFVIIPLVFS